MAPRGVETVNIEGRRGGGLRLSTSFSQHSAMPNPTLHDVVSQEALRGYLTRLVNSAADNGVDLSPLVFGSYTSASGCKLSTFVVHGSQEGSSPLGNVA